MINLLAGANVTISINEEERNILLLLVHTESISAVHSIVTAHMAPEAKTQAIISQMDFICQLRVLLWAAVAPNNQITIGELPRQVLERLVEEAPEANMGSDVLLMFRRVKTGLLSKLDSGAGFMHSLESMTSTQTSRKSD